MAQNSLWGLGLRISSLGLGLCALGLSKVRIHLYNDVPGLADGNRPLEKHWEPGQVCASPSCVSPLSPIGELGMVISALWQDHGTNKKEF